MVIHMTEQEAMEWIKERTKAGSVYGLDTIRHLLARLGDPQKQLKFVHVAGTNGKGSVCAFIASVMKCAGYRVGRYISPTIFSYQERIQVGNRPIGKKRLSELLGEMRDAVEKMEAAGEGSPTAFEIETALAFCYFVEKQCDLVVLETGLGGALDATNVIEQTLVSVFASISMDHMAILGNTIEEIAEQKSGIIKAGCRVVSMTQKEGAMSVLRKKADQLGCPFTEASITQAKGIHYGIKKQTFSYAGYKDLKISLAGTWQIDNAVLAVEVIEQLRQVGFDVTEKKLREGLISAKWIGRFTVIAEKPYFIVDGAHNEDASIRLADSLRFYFTNKRIIYIIGILRDKEYEKILRNTAELATQIITVTPPDNPRAMHAYELGQEARRFHDSVTVADSLAEAVEMARLFADKNSVIVAFGSLSYLGRLIRIVEAKDRGDNHGRSGKDQRSC